MRRIVEIQSRLYDLGAAIATPVNNSSEEKLQYTQVRSVLYADHRIILFTVLMYIFSLIFGQFSAIHTEKLESWIDDLDSQLPPLTNFILPVSCNYQYTYNQLQRIYCILPYML